MMLVGRKPWYLERNLSHCQFEHHISHIIILKANLWQMNFFTLQNGFWHNFLSFVCVCVYTHTNVKLSDSLMLFT